MRDIKDSDILIWLNSINISNRTIGKLLNYYKDISYVWHASANEIMKIKGINEKVKRNIINYRNENYLNKLFNSLRKLNVEVVTVFDKDYPKRLKCICDSPKVLYTKGSIKKVDEVSIAIVGSRKATAYGKWVSEKLSKELAKLDITVVSGMAKGIDTLAHKGALSENGRTIAVLGSGIDIIYPKVNNKLYEEICQNGSVITEYRLGTLPYAWNFPQRNRIISGISLGVVVVEANQKSGSLITAQQAAEQGREVFAVPGNINSIFSKGTNMLIKDGAKLVTNIEDILEEINELKDKIKLINNKKIDYSKFGFLERKVLKCVMEKPLHCDNIVYLTGLDISTVNSILTILEMKGIVKELPGKFYTLT